MSDWQDDDVVADQYGDAGNLGARRLLYARTSTADRSRHEWLFDQFDLPEDAEVLTLGAGTGGLWTANADRVPDGWDVTVTDAFQGVMLDLMEALEDAPRDFNFDVVDARDVPYPENSFDAVTAHHVLYHFDDADRERALAEIARVLRPGGELYASTDGEGNLAEFYDAVDDFGDRPDVSAFSLETGGDQLREQFAEVERRRFEGADLLVETPEPLVAHATSLPGFDAADGAEMEAALREHTDEGEGFAVTRDVGVFVAR